ncbi:MAG: hypothetical protein L6V35_01820 [Alistipes putredinis]|nr:MAG: hypothetical protein L6V35_01820 [Alistipes putredinis]
MKSSDSFVHRKHDAGEERYDVAALHLFDVVIDRHLHPAAQTYNGNASVHPVYLAPHVFDIHVVGYAEAQASFLIPRIVRPYKIIERVSHYIHSSKIKTADTYSTKIPYAVV